MEAAGVPAARFQVTCVGASLAAARATRFSLDLWRSERPARTGFRDETRRVEGVLARPLTVTTPQKQRHPRERTVAKSVTRASRESRALINGSRLRGRRASY